MGELDLGFPGYRLHTNSIRAVHGKAFPLFTQKVQLTVCSMVKDFERLRDTQGKTFRANGLLKVFHYARRYTQHSQAFNGRTIDKHKVVRRWRQSTEGHVDSTNAKSLGDLGR